MKKARKQVTTGTPKRSGIPCAMVLRLIARSPRGTGLDSPRDLRIARKLDPSVGRPGPHAFAVRAGALRQVAPTRPSHPGPRVVTIAIRPSSGGTGCRDHTTDFISDKANYFSISGLTSISENQPSGKSAGRVPVTSSRPALNSGGDAAAHMAACRIWAVTGSCCLQRPARARRKGRPAGLAVASVVRASAGVPNDLMVVTG